MILYIGNSLYVVFAVSMKKMIPFMKSSLLTENRNVTWIGVGRFSVETEMAWELRPLPKCFDYILLRKVLKAECKVKKKNKQGHGCYFVFLSPQIERMKTSLLCFRKQQIFFLVESFH